MEIIVINFGRNAHQPRRSSMIFWRIKVGTPASFFEDGKEPGYADFLHPFGELGVVAKGGKNKIKANLENCDDIYFFAGYADNHSAYVFRMFKVRTLKKTDSKNVDFLGKMFGEIYDKENFLAYVEQKENA